MHKLNHHILKYPHFFVHKAQWILQIGVFKGNGRSALAKESPEQIKHEPKAARDQLEKGK